MEAGRGKVIAGAERRCSSQRRRSMKNPTIVCPKCLEPQPWRGQSACLLKGCLWSNFDIAVQLGERISAGTKRHINNDHEQDGA